MQHSSSVKRKGFCEIAVSPFDPAQLVHGGGDDKRAANHDELILPSSVSLPTPPESNTDWIRQTASVRLSSGCAVVVAPESGVPLMHILQVHLNDHCMSFLFFNLLSPSCSGAPVATRVPISF